MSRYIGDASDLSRQAIPISYRGFAIISRTFQIRGSGRWTQDFTIRGRNGLRVFSGTHTFATEEAAILGCSALGRQIIDGEVKDCTVMDLG